MADLNLLAQNTLIFSMGYVIFGIFVTIYSLYLNHKQAKVHKQMKELNQQTIYINNKLSVGLKLLRELIDRTNKKS